MEFLLPHLCLLSCLLVMPHYGQCQLYRHAMTSLGLVVNTSRHFSSLDFKTTSSQLAFSPYSDGTSPLFYERMMLEYLKQEKGASESQSECSRQINATVVALLNRQDWALRMADASGKFPSGFLLGNLYLTGSYDECVNVSATVTLPAAGDQHNTIRGQYCRTGIQIAPSINPGIRFGPDDIVPGELLLGLCVPKTCSSQEVLTIIDRALKVVLRNSTLHARSVVCQPESLPLTSGAIALIVVLSLLGFVIVWGTAYDVFVIRRLHCEGEEEAFGEERSPLISQEPDNHRDFKTCGAGDHQPVVTKANIQETSDTGILCRLLLAFSLYTNGTKILATDSPKGTIGVLNGVRVLSIMWVMLGHTYAFSAFLSNNMGSFIQEALQSASFLAVTNATRALDVFFLLRYNMGSFIQEALQSASFLAVINATVAVDTFFLLSGLLVGLLSLRELSRAGGVRNVNWLMYYLHRFWRLTPPYMLTLMFYVVLFQYWYNGPFWPQHGIEVDYCSSNWWKNLLYINNFFPKDDAGGCMLWSWYLANDMQFYLISPLLVIPLYLSGMLGIAVCLTVMLASMIVSGVLSHVNRHPMGLFGQNLTETGDYFRDIYVKPYTRIGPYVVGMLTGYFLFKTGCKVRIPRAVNLAGWLVAAACCLSVVYGNHEHISGQHLSLQPVVDLYTAVHRSVWAVGVCWVIIACSTGHGGLVNRFLSWSAFIPLSRLTYMAYLVHPVVMEVYYLGMRDANYVTDLDMAFKFLGFVVASYAVAFVLSLAFESPFMGIERALRGNRKRAQPAK